MLTNPGSHFIKDGKLFKCKHCSVYKRDTHLCTHILLLKLFYK